MNKKGFTLIELLIVIAIIAILAAVVFVALDPLTRFQDARDSSRWADISGLISAIKVDQVDNGGPYLAAITALSDDTVYMIGTDVIGCDDAFDAGNCDATIVADISCVDLAGLVTEGYLGSVPISPDGNGTWTAGTTGYTLTKASTGIITVQACESENSTSISLAR
ncbi:MAG: prepilin-type N-terminal cleavage/methylation domain-containing protein [Candidatus Magasanikbacteria bacterium]|jgi:prepilin-type N-terminal cleavage/methylation domain-containing protein|nr:prepilin-type N-terminal cleavage/methylation domain-containing protein [Candidatus Magasanikbacteria bacterium]MBT4315082.1 prepilin-type N-terminal cleavage/methylation domain-containing protein [Candidatus Magasanikbacteria bacterium]MBT4546992.1 prepilin-type N-terminal cleavage/methylation domain-containing protein [Candidatus Magasanikbacteria bacterium]MBT6818762.1 prepilin-type N-terminal cleavage/methylation domain-containing protein [Candidatus Magasanikbacteria bacterium]